MLRKLLLLPLLIILLSGCLNTNINSRYPQNISYQDDVITWDAVDGAISYELRIDGHTHTVDTNTFSALILKNGSHSVQIKSIFESSESYYSPTYNFTIQRVYPNVDSIGIEDFRLNWSAATGASSYTIHTGTHNIQAGTNQILLSSLNLSVNRLYYIYVVANFPSGDTASPSPTLIHHTYIKQSIELDYVYEVGSVDFLEITIPNGATLEHIIYSADVLPIESYIINNQTLKLSAQFLESLGLGIKSFQLLTTNGLYQLDVEVKLGEVPQLTSAGSVDYIENTAPSFTFNLYGGTFTSLNGHDIQTTNYSFENNILTISSTFIDSLIASDPTATSFIFIYVLSLDDNVYTGSIEIRIP